MNEVTTDVLKQLIRENCMVRSDLDLLSEDAPLFGAEGLGLDSLDALQITMAVEKRYGIVIADPATAKSALGSIRVLREWIANAVEVRSRGMAATDGEAASSDS
jgi:acyl carrier protein